MKLIESDLMRDLRDAELAIDLGAVLGLASPLQLNTAIVKTSLHNVNFVVRT